MNEDWIDQLRNEVQAQSDDIAKIMQCPVDAFFFVLDSESEKKDIAVGFFRQPDARQSFKVMRQMGEADYETGLELLARTQLIRKSDLEARGASGDASDPRFMDLNGNYAPEDSILNFNLLKRAASLITLYSDQFKKK